MKKIVLMAVLVVPNCAWAQSDSNKPEHETTFNIALTSDYRARGIAQSRLRPALQGGADYSHNRSGWYAGAWASTISWTRDAGGSGGAEIDLYGGRRGTINSEAGYDYGVLTYIYPDNGLARVSGLANANTTEIYGQLSVGPAYLKYSHAVTNLLGFPDSKHSGYLDLGASWSLGSVTAGVHLGHQRVKHNPQASYNDYKVGILRDFGVLTGSIAFVGTNADRALYVTPERKFTGRRVLIATVSKLF